MRAQTDQEILDFCREGGYTLMTHDADFLVVRALTILADVLEPADMANHVEFL